MSRVVTVGDVFLFAASVPGLAALCLILETSGSGEKVYMHRIDAKTGTIMLVQENYRWNVLTFLGNIGEVE